MPFSGPITSTKGKVALEVILVHLAVTLNDFCLKIVSRAEPVQKEASLIKSLLAVLL